LTFSKSPISHISPPASSRRFRNCVEAFSSKFHYTMITGFYK
jgi:hypothetical protein